MQFSLAVAAASVFYLASSTWASSATITTVTSAVATLNKTMAVDIVALQTSAIKAKGAVSATALIQVEAAISANLAAVVSALVVAEGTIGGATVNGAGAISSAVSGLVQADIDTLVSDVDIIISGLQKIRASIVLIVGIGGNVRLLAQAELLALKNLIQPFSAPLQTYVSAVSTTYAKAGLSVSGLTTAQADLKTVIASIASTAV